MIDGVRIVIRHALAAQIEVRAFNLARNDLRGAFVDGILKGFPLVVGGQNCPARQTKWQDDEAGVNNQCFQLVSLHGWPRLLPVVVDDFLVNATRKCCRGQKTPADWIGKVRTGNNELVQWEASNS